MFSGIGLVLVVLVGVAIVKRREPVITVQAEKVTRRNLTEVVPGNGRIQPVLQVKISAEVSGEIIELPVHEGQQVTKGQLLVKIKPDFYLAALHQAEAGYEGAQAGKSSSEANLRKVTSDFKRAKELFASNLIPQSDYDAAQASFDAAQAQVEAAVHQVAMSKANVDSAKDSLDKTTIVAPLDGTISKLNSRLGERVLGTIQNVGTDIMTIADLNEMEARIDIGENDVILISPGQKARLEVDAFKDKKFTGLVSEIANSSKDSGQAMGGSSQEATKFEVRIRINEKEAFRPGMSITAELETRYRTNVLTVPIASVSTRLPKEKDKKGAKPGGTNAPNTNVMTVAARSAPPATNSAPAGTNSASLSTTNAPDDKKSKEPPKAIEVVFVVEGDHAKMVPVKIGISDKDYWEITDGLCEGQEVVSGPYKAINRELEDGKKIRKGPAMGSDKSKPKDRERER